MESEQQTVVTETDAGAPPPVEESGAQDTQDDVDWDELLSQYEATNQDAEPASQPLENSENQDSGLQAKVEQLQAQLASVLDKGTKADVQDLISSVGGETELPSYAVRGFIDEQAEKDPRIREAFNQREANPTAYKKVVAALNKQFASENKGRIDPNATEDAAAVNAALRGSQTTAPETPPPDLSKLSNGEYREKIMKDFGFDPGI